MFWFYMFSVLDLAHIINSSYNRCKYRFAFNNSIPFDFNNLDISLNVLFGFGKCSKTSEQIIMSKESFFRSIFFHVKFLWVSFFVNDLLMSCSWKSYYSFWDQLDHLFFLFHYSYQLLFLWTSFLQFIALEISFPYPLRFIFLECIKFLIVC